MARKQSKVSKSYLNTDFLMSPDARVLRILSEYLFPLKKFREEKVKDTIVFYGSARIMEPGDAARAEKRARERVAKSPADEILQKNLVRAEADLEMAKYYEDARTLAHMLTKWSRSFSGPWHRFLVCSGGGPGIMEAANRGAAEAGGKTVGLTISLPYEKQGNEFISENLGFEFHYFFMRKYWFVYMARALVIFPGGFGTLDELMDLLTLLQTRKIRRKLPVVMYGSRFWNDVINLDALVKWGTISPEDLDLIRFCDTPEDAYEHLRRELTTHSGKPLSRKAFEKD